MDGSKFSQAMQGIGGAAGVLGSWAGAYMGGPKAASNKGFLKKAAVAGNWNFGASDMSGLMSQIQNAPRLQNISREDLFNPSNEEVFGSMFASGMGSYGAMSGLSAPLKGSMGTTFMNGTSGYNTANGKGWGEIGKSIEEQKAAGRNFDGENGYNMLEQEFELPYANYGACGGHLHGCGGHKFAGGGIALDNGTMLAEALNLLSGGIGVALNYAGQMNQRAQAEMEAKEVNATNLYAQQLMSHNQNEAVNDTKNNTARWAALQTMAYGGNLFEDGGLPINVLSTGYSQLGGGVQTVRQGTVGNNSIYQFNLQSPEGFTASESTLVTPDFINMDLGNENARTIVRSKNPAEYAYQQQRIAGLQGKNLNPGNILPEVTVVARRHAMGGDLQTHGAEFPLDGNFNIIGAGGTHEHNPFGGVYQGMASDGKPNLVEEDEVVWNDYVFSNRLTIPKEFAKARKLKEDITYADAAKRLSKEAEERANDVISQNGLAESLGALMESQEELKQKREATRVKRAIAKMSPDEVMGMMAALNGGQPDVFAEGGLLSHQFDGKSSTTGKMSRRAKKAAAEAKAKQEHGLYESGVGNLNSEWLKYIASQIEGFDANKYKYAGADADIRQFVLDNYDKLGGWEGLNQAFRRGSQMPLLAENSPLRNYRYTEREGYSMTPEQWNTFFGSLNAYRESRKAGNTSGKYHADSNFDNSGKTAAQVEQDPRYQAFKRYVREQATKYANGEQADENALRYLRTLDEGINTSKGAQRLLEYNPDGSVKMVDGRMQLRRGWEADYDKRNYDQIGGIYHFYTDTPDVTKTKTGERHIVRLNGEEIEITPEEMAKIGRFTHGDNYISQVTEKDENGNDVTTHYYDYESPEVQAEYTPEETPGKQPPLPTWMRYAPLLSGLGALQGPAKDYSTAVSPITAHYAPIGDYLPYLPVDTQRYINAENQQAAAQLNAIMNASAGNRNMAMAQAALANSQRQQGIGQRMQAAEQINWDRLRTAGEFNRGTNMFNAQAHNAAEIANLQVNPLLLRQEQQNQMMKYQADRDRDAAVSESLNAFLDSLGAIGRENLAWNQVNSNEALRYFSDPNWLAAGQSGYKKPTIGKTVTMSVGAPTAEEAAFGGYLLSKSKKNRR